MKPRLALAIVVLGAALTLGACGSSSNSAATSSTASAGSRVELASCLRKHGITLPAGAGRRAFPGGGTPPSGSGAPPSGAPQGGFPGGANSTKFQTAMKACGAKFPAGPRPTFSRQAIQKYVTCVRRHGYNLPEPNFSRRGSVFPASARSNPKFQSASRACQNLLVPQRGTRGVRGA